MNTEWQKSTFSASNGCVEAKVEFHKSSYSNANGCVEVGIWHKSTYSGANGCVEVAAAEHGELVVLVRDSKNQGGPVLEFTRHEWEAFLAGVLNGEFDLPQETRLPEGAEVTS
jgi:hypothetical protein